MAGIDGLTPARRSASACCWPGQPEEPDARGAAGAALAELGLSAGEAVGSLIVFVVIGSLRIAAPVFYYLIGGAGAKARLDELKDWLALHNNAVMAVLLLVFGAKLIADGLPPLS